MSRPSTRACVTRVVVCAALACSCGPRPPVLPPYVPIPEPAPQDVESVIFLFGDAGDVRDEDSPLLVRLKQDVEKWSAALDADSSVMVIALGDIVYPLGVTAPDADGYAADTAVAMSQLRLVAGPRARSHGARAYFVAGNHDWKSERDEEGRAQLEHLDGLIDAVRKRDGLGVQLVPAAGTGGPHVIDWGRRFRILLLDTAWWILQSSDTAQTSMLSRIEQAVSTRGERDIMIASHHPFISAGPHGGEISVRSGMGLRYPLSRSGAILEDITSLPYRRLEQGFRSIFDKHEPPMIFAGGHDHSLQVIAGALPTDPIINLVSGAGSKLDGVGSERGLRFARSAPGYMRLVFERNGGVTVFVESTDPAFLKCDDEDERARCMADGVAAFQTVYGRRVR
jgi:hypothetical protein